MVVQRVGNGCKLMEMVVQGGWKWWSRGLEMEVQGVGNGGTGGWKWWSRGVGNGGPGGWKWGCRKLGNGGTGTPISKPMYPHFQPHFQHFLNPISNPISKKMKPISKKSGFTPLLALG